MIIDAALTNDISFWTGFYQDDTITWACPICNYEWKLAIYLRVKGRQCPECRRNK
ncbi:MAG: zinc-ribbon domain-containing protein [Clostridia bacterium]|nr:zinc-ribbon domain-containing protein [Clostridia bacterium]